MKVSRRALMMGAGAAAWELALPLRRSFAEPEIKEYRLTAKQAVVEPDRRRPPGYRGLGL